MKAKKPVLEAYFPPYQWFYWTFVSKKKKKKYSPITYVWTLTNYVNFTKIGSKLRPVLWQ